MKWEDIVEIATQWPEVIEAVSYGEPSLKVRNRLLARQRLEDNSVVFMDVPVEEREYLLEMFPNIFFCEPHYEGHEIVLARLTHLNSEFAHRLLERRWRNSATKRAVAAYDAAG